MGAGIVGLATALELARAGLQVTVLERARVGAGASHGNAGMLVPSHSLPLARPGALMVGLAALAGRGGALRLAPLREPGQVEWLTRFVAACRPGVGWRLVPAIHGLARTSIARYLELLGEGGRAESDLSPLGWLSVYRSRVSLDRGVRDARRLGRLGDPWGLLAADELRALEPNLARPAAGAILHSGDWVVSPDRLAGALAALADRAGVEVRTGAEVTRLETGGGRVRSASGPFGELEVGRLVLAAGWETERWLSTLGFRGHIFPARGYSLTVARTGGEPAHPINLVDSHVVVSLLGDRVRATTGLDLGPPRPASDRLRLDELRAAARGWLPDLPWDAPLEEWTGVRPLTPDGRPLIGPLPGWENVLVASGHGMLGVTLAPATGMLIRRWITDPEPPPGGGPFRPR